MRSPEKDFCFVTVVLDEAIETLLDYSIPHSLIGKVHVGSRALVPVKNTLRKATVWALKKTPGFPVVRPIDSIASEQAVLTSDLIELAKWISRYYSAPMHKVLKTLLPSSIRKHMKELSQWVVEAKEPSESLRQRASELKTRSPRQAKALELLSELKGKATLALLIEKTQVTKASILSLEKKGALTLKMGVQERVPSWDDHYFISEPKALSEEQSEALSKIQQDLRKNHFASHLLFGVTGSGKTEVYLQAIDEALKLDKGVIFLVPEIALTSQTIERLKSRFEEKIALLHYKLSEGEKRDTWHQIHARKARIVIGARSAVFCPVPELGLIIVDEEHDSAYKQTGETPMYQGRDVAIVRAKLCGAVAVLGSATPSMESYENALKGKYTLSLLTQRHGKAKLPKVHIVDMKHECSKHKGLTLFSDKLLTGIKERLSRGEQTLLLLNRRGYHSSQICLSCSHIMECPECETALTYHLSDNVLACHLCDYRIEPSNTCPKCQETSSMKFRGAGTELVEKKLQKIFPSCRVLRMDADTTKKKGSHEKIFKQFKSGKADLLIGTQMVAKGLHFPAVTLVGVLNADLTLAIPDFRASESMFQLITQVAGRSGRGDIPGEVIVQTFLPDQSTLKHASEQNYEAFFQEEKTVRELFSYPPFTHLIKVSFSGEDPKKTQQAAEGAKKFLLEHLPTSFEVLNVAPAGHAKIKGKYRFQFLLKSPQVLSAASLLTSLQSQCKNKDFSIHIDVDPSSTFF